MTEIKLYKVCLKCGSAHHRLSTCSNSNCNFSICPTCADLKKRVEEAIDLIGVYGGIDGGHHKQWLLDQIMRVLHNNYAKWVKDWQKGEDGPHTYTWDIGIAP